MRDSTDKPRSVGTDPGVHSYHISYHTTCSVSPTCQDHCETECDTTGNVYLSAVKSAEIQYQTTECGVMIQGNCDTG